MARSNAQIITLSAYALIFGPALLCAPSMIAAFRDGALGVGTGVAAAVLICVGAGIGMLRYKSRRMADRTEQQRCNKCGAEIAA